MQRKREAVATNPTQVDEPDEPIALRRSGLIVGLGVAASALLVVAQLWLGVPFNSTTQTTEREVLTSTGATIVLTETSMDDAGRRDALFRGVAGIAAVTAGLLAWGRLELSRREHLLGREASRQAIVAQQLAAAGHDLAVESKGLTSRSQTAERFTRAVEQLQSASVPVRTGGLYALERLAADAPDEMRAVYDVVCAFARHHSTGAEGDAADLRAAIAIALRCPTNEQRRDLSGIVVTGGPHTMSELRNINFAESRWVAVSFEPTDLTITDVNFDHAQLTDTTFPETTTMRRVTFGRDAKLTRVKFEKCHLEDVRFDGVLDAVDFDLRAGTRPVLGRGDDGTRMHDDSYPHLSRVEFRGEMRSTKFGEAHFEGVTFKAIEMLDVDLDRVRSSRRGSIIFGSGLEHILHQWTQERRPTKLINVRVGRGAGAGFSRDVTLQNVRFEKEAVILGSQGLTENRLSKREGSWYTTEPAG